MSTTNTGEMPPPYSGSNSSRYHPIPQSDAYHPSPAAGPVGYSQPQPYPGQGQPMMAPQGGYAPAPPVMGQQSSSTNVVVVNQPSAMPSAIIVASRPRAASYLTLTLVMMAICFIHGNILAFICLIPALIFAIISTNHNDEGNFAEAKRFGHLALGCNIGMFVKYGVLILVFIILLIVYVTGGLARTAASQNCYHDCETYSYCRDVCA